MYIRAANINVKNFCFITTCFYNTCETAKINFVKSGAVDIIITAYYVHGSELMKLIFGIIGLDVSVTMGLTHCYKTEVFFTILIVKRQLWLYYYVLSTICAVQSTSLCAPSLKFPLLKNGQEECALSSITRQRIAHFRLDFVCWCDMGHRRTAPKQCINSVYGNCSISLAHVG